MAEIDANVVQIHFAPQHPRALLEQATEESRVALTGHRVTIAVEEPTSRPGSIHTCWEEFCGICWKMRQVTRRRGAGLG